MADQTSGVRHAASTATALSTTLFAGLVLFLGGSNRPRRAGQTWGPPRAAYTEVSRFPQGEQRGPDGRIIVEASIIHVINCAGGGQYYVYQYTNRPGYRAILPPNWSNAIGGRDFATYAQAASVACGGYVSPPAPAYQQIQTITQPEQRDPSGRVTVEASIVHVIQCNGAEYYIYQYTNRGGYRAIRPPDWSSRALTAGAISRPTTSGGREYLAEPDEPLLRSETERGRNGPGDPGWIRTSNRPLRRRMLYPVELRGLSGCSRLMGPGLFAVEGEASA